MDSHGTPDRELERIADAYRVRGEAGSDERYQYGNPGNLFLIQSRDRGFLKTLRTAELWPFENRSILELGCGNGFWLRQFIQWGACPARVTGVELLDDRVAIARRSCPSETTIIQGHAGHTGLPAATFELVFQSTMFTSVLDGSMRQSIADEMRRLVRPGGAIVSYDFRYRSPRNPDVAPLTASELVELFPDCRIEIRSMTLAPPIARRIAPVSHLVCGFLDLLPFLRTHLFAIIRPNP